MPDPKTGLDALAGDAKRAGAKGPPPVHLWNPPFCGDLDMRIAADGTWFYLKTPIGRPALVKLFASVLRRDGEKYFLVTPVEKVGITVDDAPFTAVEMKLEGEGVALFYDLVELGEEREVDGRRMFGVVSGGEFYVMAPADALKGLR